MNCPCGNEIEYDFCCAPFIDGEVKPKTAEDLMRSRYTAFVVQKVNYVYDTHHPDFRKNVQQKDLEDWSKNSDWIGLKILNTENGQESDNEGWVEFLATYSVNGVEQEHHELSQFSKINDSWYFTHGKIINNTKETIVREGPKIGRNAPCFCGSGKKYKKCCGK